MKKLFTLFFALFMMAFCAKAQITDDFESYTAFTVDPSGTWTYYDGDQDTTYGFSSVEFTNQNYVGSCIVFNPSQTNPSSENDYAPHSGSQFIAFFSSTTTQNNDWMISPALTFTNGCILSLYARELTTQYGDEIMNIMYSTTNNTPNSFTLLQTVNVNHTDWQNYTFNIPANATYVAINCTSNDAFALFIDDISITSVPTDPTIVVAPTTIDFGTVNIPAFSDATANIIAYNLTSAITATTSAPFEVSADGTIYGTTATIAQTGGTLYVKYTPTTAGTDNGTVTLTSGTITASISLSGNAFDCSNITLPLTESFEGADCPTTCWSIIYGDNDPTVNTMTHSTSSSTDGLQSFRFSSYSQTSDYTQYLITPAIPAGDRMLLFDYAASNPSSETFQVGYSSTGNNISDFTWGTEMSASNADGWQTYAEAVPANAIYIAIKYYSNYLYYLYIDNFRVMEAGESLSTNPDAMDFIGIMGTPTDAQTATFVGTSLTNDITITTAAPFEVSTNDGATFAATASIPYSTTSSVMNGDFQVRYNPTTAGSHNGIVVITSGNSSDTIVVSGNATDCSAGIATLPYTYDFNTGLYPPLCWGYNDATNFIKMTINEEDGDNGIAFGAVDYLSSPEIHSSSSILFSIDYATYGGSAAESPSSFRIGYSSTNDNYSDFTWMQAVSVMTDGFNTHTAILPAGTKYIAIEATAIGSYLIYGIFEYPNYLVLDNFSLEEINESVIYAGASTINFGTTIINENKTETVAITGALLTEDITATTTAPFEVSADNSTFGTTATIPAAGGNLYVRYAPTTAGAHTGNVTLASTGATSVTISLSGNAVDCSGAVSLPFFEGFEDETPSCWLNIDNDGDGFGWYSGIGSQYQTGHTGEGSFASASYDNATGGALNPDNWLISPAINIPAAGATMSWWAVSHASEQYLGDHYEVMVSSTGTSIDDFTSVYEETISSSEWAEHSIDLSQFAGQTIHIAFVHNNSTDLYIMQIDDINITAGSSVTSIESSNVTVYPNPAHNYINVNATSNINNVEVFTIAGQKVGDFTANGTQTVISTSNLSNGMYLMRINTENGVINKKFSVVR